MGYETFLTPKNSSVLNFARRYGNGEGYTLAKSLYDAVRDNILFKADATDQWSLPANTIRRGYGDCEDLAALLASLYLSQGMDAKLLVFYPFGWEIAHVVVLLKDFPKVGWNRLDPTRTRWNFEDKTRYAPINMDIMTIDITGEFPAPEFILSPLINLTTNIVNSGLLPNSRIFTPLLEETDIPPIKDYHRWIFGLRPHK